MIHCFPSPCVRCGECLVCTPHTHRVDLPKGQEHEGGEEIRDREEEGAEVYRDIVNRRNARIRIRQSRGYEVPVEEVREEASGACR